MSIETSVSTGSGLSPDEADERNCYLTTTGRVSGLPHEIEIWFAAHPSRSNLLYLMAGGRDRADWVRNIRASGAVRVRVSDSVYVGTARWVDEASDEDALVRDVVTAKYGERESDGSLSEWGRTALPIAIELHERLKGSPE
jgi:deazaflavin-dependent oxidoreductase (nitroreductase family)